MKRLVSLIVMAICCLSMSAQVNPDSIKFDDQGEFSIVVPTKANARQIFLYSQAYFRSNDPVLKTKIELTDSVSHKVQVHTSFAGDDFNLTINSGTVNQMFTTEHVLLTVIAKDNRFKVKVERSNFEYDSYILGRKMGHEVNRPYFGHVGMGEKFSGVENLKATINKNRAKRFADRINKMVEYIENQIADEDF